MVGLPGRVISLSQGLYLNTGQHKHRLKHIHIPNIHALWGIQTHDPGFRVSENSTCLRPLGYRDRLFVYTVFIFHLLLLVEFTHDYKSMQFFIHKNLWSYISSLSHPYCCMFLVIRLWARDEEEIFCCLKLSCDTTVFITTKIKIVTLEWAVSNAICVKWK
jgi:hypothetical protein